MKQTYDQKYIFQIYYRFDVYRYIQNYNYFWIVIEKEFESVVLSFENVLISSIVLMR